MVSKIEQLSVTKAYINDQGALLGTFDNGKDFIIFKDNVAIKDQLAFKKGAIIALNSSSNWKGKIVPNFYTVIKQIPIGLDAEINLINFNNLTTMATLHQLDSIYNLLIEHKDLLLVTPAACGHHHAYIGGLLQHINEIISYIYTLCNESNTNKEELAILIGAAIMHDFAKIWEYSVSTETGVITYNTPWIEENRSHIKWSYDWCIRRSIEYPILANIANIVASHHGDPILYCDGKIKHVGSFFKPVSRLENIFHMCDKLSCLNGKITLD